MTLSLDEIRRRFRERGVRMTPQRAAIYGALARTANHPTAEDLYREVKKIHPMISQNTVYYTLGVLREAGLVREVNYWHDRSRFDANIDLHHHLICLGCRKIEDLMDATLDRLPMRVGGRLDFEVTGHRVEFHGYCAACRRRKRPGAAARRMGPHPSQHLSVQRRRKR
ncbi:MAG TPA: transcriptional repressor [Nitrospiraceae bacterium]|jgi:Fur family peroxide stress response transcriptional regulator|nr:transcriptional repressor [Nitrospiraceae bacterium]